MSQGGEQEQTEAAPVRIVTDSLAWIPPDLAQAHHIRVVPLHVTIDGEHFTETVDLTNEEFYRRLRAARSLPTTSQPSAGEFLDVYREVAREAAAILSVHASSKLSGTVRSAETAAAQLRQEQPHLRIEVLDTLTIATAEGIVALRAAQQAARGEPLERILAAARELAPKTRVLVAVETLEYLQKGGRIGRARALLGGLLHIRPILTIAGGEVAPKDRVRTRARALERMVELMAADAAGRPFSHVAVLHADAAEVADELAGMIQQRFAVEWLIRSEIGPVIGTHVGPGAVGITYHCE